MTSGLPEDMVRPRCSGYDAFLQKPIDIKRVLQTLSALARAPAADA
jgi:hypothetical protein